MKIFTLLMVAFHFSVFAEDRAINNQVDKVEQIITRYPNASYSGIGREEMIKRYMDLWHLALTVCKDKAKGEDEKNEMTLKIMKAMLLGTEGIDKKITTEINDEALKRLKKQYPGLVK